MQITKNNEIKGCLHIIVQILLNVNIESVKPSKMNIKYNGKKIIKTTVVNKIKNGEKNKIYPV